MINNDKHSEGDSVAPIDRNKLAVGNSAKHGSLKSSVMEDDASSRKKKIQFC